MNDSGADYVESIEWEEIVGAIRFMVNARVHVCYMIHCSCLVYCIVKIVHEWVIISLNMRVPQIQRDEVERVVYLKLQEDTSGN